MIKKIDYYWPRTLCMFTCGLFFTQLVLEATGAIVRKPGFEWVTPACAGAFLLSVLYAGLVITINARRARSE